MFIFVKLDNVVGRVVYSFLKRVRMPYALRVLGWVLGNSDPPKGPWRLPCVDLSGSRCDRHSRQLPTNLKEGPTFCLYIRRVHILGSSTELSMLRELGPSLEELPPTALSSDLLAILSGKLSNRYHGTHLPQNWLRIEMYSS